MNKEEIDSLKEIIKNLSDQLDRELIKRARLEDRIKKAIKHVRKLQEKYFRMCVAGSNNDFIDLLEILKGEE